jgi:polynucleotide 5'-hydroxyl-kinase GRC3/NOL9
MSFIGVFNPSKRIPLMLRSIKALFDIAKNRSSMHIIVDTTGLVSGEIGFYLKTRKIKLIRPDYVIALQRDNELEHILSAIEEFKIIRAPVSAHVKERTRQYRINYRNRRFKEYFQDLHIHYLSLNDVSLIYKDNLYKPSEIFIKENTVLGLNREGDITMGLGLFERISEGKIFITTPLEILKEINKIIVGEIQYLGQ